MKANDKHSPDEVYARLRPPYQRSEEAVWQHLTMRMDAEKEVRDFRPIRMFGRIAVAASVALLLGTGIAMRFYTTQMTTPPGTTIQVVLPDGSLAHLKAATTLKYHPYWWRMSREVTLRGEAFFEGHHADGFAVVTGNVTTSVLGTSFNVYARNNLVDVTCVTGKVQVAMAGEGVVLASGDRVVWNDHHRPVTSHVDDPAHVKAWVDDAYYYESMPLSRVFEDVQLRQNVSVKLSVPIDSLIYTGYLHEHHSVLNILNWVGKPFGLAADSLGNDVYLIRDAHSD